MVESDAIKSMKNIIDYWCYKATEVEAAKLAIRALEKQVSQQTIKTPTSSQACPVCRANVNRNYCPNCGQKLDWRMDS